MDVTMTATMRPELVDQTLESFRRLLLGSGPDHRLIANIDPVGDSSVSRDDVEAVMRQHFGDQVLIRRPKRPCFPAALRWCWEQTESDYVFNLEDDWELLVELDLAEMLSVMELHPWLAALRLPKRATFETECCQSASVKEPRYQWNGYYFECPKGQTAKNGYYGSPSLLRGDWVRAAAPLLKRHASPEKQFRRLREQHHPDIWCWEYGIYSKPNTLRTIRDLGTEWRRERGIEKNSHRNFVKWVY